MRVHSLLAGIALLAAVPAAAQDGMDMPMPMPMSDHMHMSSMETPLGVSESREGSGTSWLPDDTPAQGPMRHVSGWMLMAHGRAFLQGIAVSGDRGDRQAGSINWAMGMARHALGGGQFTARLMMSAEPLTVGRCGYPDLLQSGETCRGAALHDRQHPHDLFMEAAVGYTRAIDGRVGLEFYGGPVGEPALGPTAFPHRPSAWQQPLAPISHHWLDATHVSFGVATAGLFGRRWKVEASAFNGREPDDRRYGIDVARLDSWSTRATWMPRSSLALQASTGLLRHAEVEDAAFVDVRRTTISATHNRVIDGRLWATTAAWGVNAARGERSHAVLVETAVDVSGRGTLFARGEWVQKTGHDLDLEALSGARAGVGRIQAGYTRWLGSAAGLWAGVGGTAGLGLVPAALRAAYGAHPGEAAVFITVAPRPAR